MSYTRSLRDTLAEISASVKRDLSDVTIDHLGTETQVLRIALGEKDVLGDRDETLKTYIVSNVIIKHPMGNNQWLFSHNESDNTSQTDALNIWDLLPITMKIKYSSAFDYDNEPVNIQLGDMIVELLKDENDNSIPVIMQVSKLVGGFEGKYLYQKHYEMALYRGIIPADIQHAIDLFIAGETTTTRVRQGNTTIVTRTEYINNSDNLIMDYTSSQIISAFKAIAISSNKAIYADSTDLTHIDTVLGVSTHKVNIGGYITIQTYGKIVNSNWNWDLTSPIFLGQSGELTQSVPTYGFIMEMGTPLASNSMFIDIKEPIVLST